MFESKAKINLWVECGDDYYFGRDGEIIDYEMVSNFYFKAMKKKHPRATYMIGLCYELGRGVDTDMEYAEILYEKSAEYGNENARKRFADGIITCDEESPFLAKLHSIESDNKAFWAAILRISAALNSRLKPFLCLCWTNAISIRNWSRS